MERIAVRRLGTYRCLPHVKRLRAPESIIDRLHQVAAEAEEILGQSMEREKLLSLLCRGKPAHVIFLLARRLMRDFHAVIGIDRIHVVDRRHDLSVSRVITAEFVSVEPARFTALAVDQAAKEAHGGLFVAPPLDEDINGIAVLIDRTPEVLMLPVNGDDDFIEVPRITQCPLAFLESTRIGGAKLQAPTLYRFISDDDATLSQQLFDFAKTETEAMIQPDGMTDNFCRKPMTLVADGLSLHAKQSAKNELM